MQTSISGFQVGPRTECQGRCPARRPGIETGGCSPHSALQAQAWGSTLSSTQWRRKRRVREKKGRRGDGGGGGEGGRGRGEQGRKKMDRIYFKMEGKQSESKKQPRQNVNVHRGHLCSRLLADDEGIGNVIGQIWSVSQSHMCSEEGLYGDSMKEELLAGVSDGKRQSPPCVLKGGIFTCGSSLSSAPGPP